MSPALPRYFRAPYGAWNTTHAAKLNAIASVRDYIGPVYWSVGGALVPNVVVNYKTNAVTGSRPKTAAEITQAADWDCWSSSKKFGYSAIPVEVCLAGYLKETRRKGGGVVLMHDLTLNTVDMVSQFIPALLQEGYSFVNLNDLRSLEQYK
jgi:peptidoglycan/xylan/chitin deacetylase (PgdA/CDA1 family)